MSTKPSVIAQQGDEPKTTAWGLFLWAFSGVKPRLYAFIATLIVVLACEVTIPLLLGRTVDAAISKEDIDDLLHIGLYMVGVIVVLYTAHVIYMRMEATLVADATLRLRSKLYTRIITQPLAFFSKNKGGELGHRIMGDTEVIEKHAIYLLADVPFAIVTVIAVVGIMFYTNWSLALVVVAFLTIAAFLSHRVGRPIAGLEKIINGFYSRIGGHLQESINGIRAVKTFGREDHELARLNNLGLECRTLEQQSGKIAAKLEPLLNLIEMLGLVIVVWCGAYLVYQDKLTPGELVTFIAYMEFLSEPMSRAGRFYRQYLQCKGTFGRIAEFLSTLPVHFPRTGKTVDGTLNVEFQDVSYTYAGADHPATDHVSFTAQRGEVIGVVGSNGAGKSTLMDLLLGFQTTNDGNILVGGVPLNDWDEAAYRNVTAVMSQDVFLFNAPLMDNIRYGQLDATDEAVRIAASLAGLDPLIARLPQGFDTILGDRGSKLSGGERQRVAMARVLLRNPQILVFDEPTSALDGAAIADINARIKAFAPGRVTFVIAHRLDTVSIADRVLMLEHGKLIASGSVAELQANSPEFQALFEHKDEKPKGKS